MRLDSDEERDRFIEQFWYRRASDPRLFVNDFEQEHYRRIIFANENFSTEIPGWKTDRGHVYILFGPPDHVESHPGTVPSNGDSGSSITNIFEKWHYNHIEGIGSNIEFDFIARSATGNYYLRVPLPDKDIDLLNSRRSMGHIPGRK